jgi:hypothetical protein
MNAIVVAEKSVSARAPKPGRRGDRSHNPLNPRDPRLNLIFADEQSP